MEKVKDIETLVNEEVEDRSKVLAFVPKIPLGFSTGISFELPFNKNFNYKNILVVGNLRGIFGEFTYYSKKENGKPDWEFNPNTERYNEEGRANLYWLRRCLENGTHVTFIERLEDHWFLTENQSYFDIVKECVVECMVNDNIRYSQINHVKVITGPDSKFNLDDYINKNMKFDVCIMNAPYANGLHEKFEVAGIDLVSDEIVWIGPISWLLGKKQKKELTERCNRYYTNIQTICSEEYFDANIGGSMGIVYINKKKERNIEYNGITYSTCSEIKHFSDDLLITSAYRKIKPYNFIDNLHIHVNKVNEEYYEFSNVSIKEPNINEYIYRLLPYSGQSNARSKQIGEFWGITSRNKNYENECGTYGHVKDVNKETKYYIKFDNETQLMNFWKFIHTDFSMLCLYFIKTTLQLARGELNYLPWLDWNQEWDDLKLFKKFGLNKKEVEHIYKVIPNYFSNNREDVLKNY